MDESSIKLCPQVKKGWALADRRKLKSLLRHGRGGTLIDRRSSVTLVSFLCDSEEVQPRLPQVFLSSEHVLSKSDVKVLKSYFARIVLFSRRKSGWVHNSTLVKTLTLLAKFIGSFVRTHRVILFMDTSEAHLHVSVLLPLRIPLDAHSRVNDKVAPAFGCGCFWEVQRVGRPRVGAQEGCSSRRNSLSR